MFKPRWYTVLGLIAFATIVRLFPYIWMQFNIEVDPQYLQFLPWNFAPLMAITLFAGAHFRNSVWAFLLPLTVLAASDVGIYLVSGHPEWALYANQPVVYGSMLLCGLLSLALRNRSEPFPKAGMIFGMGFVAETVFFLVTNFGVWKFSAVHPQTAAGLMEVYTLGLPFYLRSLVSTGLYSGLLFFGLRVYVENAIRREERQPEQVSAQAA